MEGSIKKKIKVSIESGVCGVSHTSTNSWGLLCDKEVTMYTSYCNKHVYGSDGKECPYYISNKYDIARFSATTAHEFGHVMKLYDLYISASLNHGKTIVANTEVAYDDIKKFALPEAKAIMMNNGIATPNDIEMVIYAYVENEWQYFVPCGSSQKMSKAIRSDVTFIDEGGYYFIWDEEKCEFIATGEKEGDLK